jgi:hypothetical protein
MFGITRAVVYDVLKNDQEEDLRDRSQAPKSRIVFTVDNSEEFGVKNSMKGNELRKLIGGFGCGLIQNHKGHCEENAHFERSHRTDDDEFYIPRVLLRLNSEKDLLNETLGYILLLREPQRAFVSQLPDPIRPPQIVNAGH